MIEIGCSHFQSRYKPLKLCLICRCGLPLLVTIWKKEPTASPVITKWWQLELTLANFGSHAQMVTKFGGQILATKFGFVPDWLVTYWCQWMCLSGRPMIFGNKKIKIMKSMNNQNITSSYKSICWHINHHNRYNLSYQSIYEIPSPNTSVTCCCGRQNQCGSTEGIHIQ